MGQSLDAYAVYGFAMERYPEDDTLPDGFSQGLTNAEIAEATYMDAENIEFDTIVTGVVELKYPLLGVAYPGMDESEEMVVFVKRTEVNAYYASEPLKLEEATAEEEAQIRSLALLLGKNPGWLIYPTYG